MTLDLRARALAVTCFCILSGCSNGDPSSEACTVTGPFGSGRNEVYLLGPGGEPETIVLFAHGWTAVEPDDWHRIRLDHLCADGSLVVFPRYQVDALDSFEQASDGFRSGVRTAFARLRDIDVPIVAVGYSFGGALVSYYAGNASAWNVPEPQSVLAIFPTGRVPGRPAGTPPQSTAFLLVAGDMDEVVGTAGADDLRAWLESRERTADYRLVRSTHELTATHEALKQRTSASDREFWEPIDELVEAAREAR